MHLNRKIAVAAAVLAGAMSASLGARASTVITNTGYIDFTNEAAVAQTAVVGNTVFVVAANPVLAVAKTRDVARGPAGTIVTYQIKVTYPQLGTACDDDSAAKNIIVRDTIPAGLKYIAGAGNFRVSYDNGGSWANLSVGADADEGDVSVGASDIITVNLTPAAHIDFPEGSGACVAGTARIVEFKAQVQ